MPPRTDRRSELNQAAARIAYQNGISGLTLATVSNAAEVPLGSLYYYFKTREDVIEAVVAGIEDQVSSKILEFDAQPDPGSALKSFVMMVLGNAEALVNYGCPIGTLTAQLRKEPGEIGRRTGGVLGDMAEWAQSKFQALGMEDTQSRREGRMLMIKLEGAAMMAHATSDESYVIDTGTAVCAEIDNLSNKSSGALQ